MFPSTLPHTIPLSSHLLPYFCFLKCMLPPIIYFSQHNILWCLYYFPVSCPGIPVSGFSHIFVIIFQHFFKTMHAPHLSNANPISKNGTFSFLPFPLIQQIIFQIFTPFKHYFWISIIFGSTRDEIHYSFFKNISNFTLLFICTPICSPSFLYSQ